MADHDELPYIVIERRSGGAGAFLAGALLGAGAALLLAPRSGREVRTGIRSGVLRLRDQAEDKVREVSDTFTGTIGGVRGEVQGRLDTAREAFEAGRRAARETRQEMEQRVREVRAGVHGGVAATRGRSSAEPPHLASMPDETAKPPAAGYGRSEAGLPDSPVEPLRSESRPPHIRRVEEDDDDLGI